MHLLLFPLGVLAKWSDSCSRQIVNGIPFNWFLIFGGLLFAFICDETRRTAWENGQTPQKIGAAQFADLPGSAHKFVSVRGYLHPQYRIHYEGSKNGDLVLMTDPATKRGFWVDNPGVFQEGTTEITGLSWGMSSDLRSDVEREAGTIGQKLGVAIDSNLKLNAGESPGSGVGPLLAELGFGTLGLSFLLMSLARNLVFARQKETPSHRALGSENFGASGANPAAEKDETLFWSGPMRLHQKCGRRFLQMPTQWVRLGDGTLALATLTDASTYTEGGGVSASRAGLWVSVPDLKTLKIENGCQFCGLQIRPALRLKFSDRAQKGQKTTALLAFESEAARAQTLENLRREMQKGESLA